MTTPQIMSEAKKLFEQNPGFFENNAQNAIDYVERQDQRNQQVNQAFQQRRQNETDVQRAVVDSLRHQSDLLKVKVPANVYSKLEDEAVKSVKTAKEGGKGWTERQAALGFGKELDKISRDYANTELASSGLLSKAPKEIIGAVDSLRTKFAARDDLENFADYLQSNNKISNQLAYALAYPIKSNAELNQAFKKVPDLAASYTKPGKSFKYKAAESPEARIQKTLDLAPSLASKLGKNGSPLSVAYELQKRGYDPLTWINYIRENRNNLDLSERQGRQIDKSANFLTPLKDSWLEAFSGIE